MNPKIGDYLTWKDKLAKIIGRADVPTVMIEMIEDDTCPHCGKSTGKHQFSVIPTSPLFQESAKPIQTITT